MDREEILNYKLKYNELYHCYQSLLSDTQKAILEEFLVYDLSLSEIAEDRKISRAAVEDAIKKGVSKLDAFEDSLKIFEKKQKILENTAKLKELAGNSKELKAIITDIEKEII